MPVLILILLVAGIVFGPQLWVKWVIARHGRERRDYPGTGAEMARHLLDIHDLHDVKVETTDKGDHYSPTERTVRLEKRHHDGCSISAVAIAAHEVGHALQHADGDRMLRMRSGIATVSHYVNQIGAVLLWSTPVFAIVAGPRMLLVQAMLIILVLGIELALHLVTLPVELDASFRRALPLLAAGNYLPDQDYPAVRSVLRAAAFTYVAAAAIGLLNFWRLARFA